MTIDEAWQEYAKKIMPVTKDNAPASVTLIHPLAELMYKTFVAGWEAARIDTVKKCALFVDDYVSDAAGIHYDTGNELKKHFGVKE